MKKIMVLILLLSSAYLSGCVDMQAVQRGMNEIDNHWEDTNSKYLVKYGERQYPISLQQAKEATLKAMEEMGFGNEYRGDNLMRFRASADTPLTKDEYKHMKEVEEPIMQAIAATEVGDFTASMFKLSNGKDFDIVVAVRMDEITEAIKIGLNFNMFERKPNPHIVYGDQPPPEAVKVALDKFWESFEKHSENITGKPVNQI